MHLFFSEPGLWGTPVSRTPAQKIFCHLALHHKCLILTRDIFQKERTYLLNLATHTPRNEHLPVRNARNFHQGGRWADGHICSRGGSRAPTSRGHPGTCPESDQGWPTPPPSPPERNLMVTEIWVVDPGQGRPESDQGWPTRPPTTTTTNAKFGGY